MDVLDLFSGIGGISLGLERAGFKTIAFCEKDKHCHKILKKNFPNVPIFNDVKDLSADNLPIKPDVICGGFPCVDISRGGAMKGIHGKESSLWFEFKRLIKEIRPSYVIIENVENLRNLGLGIILKNLSEIGYDVEWHCITARRFGLPHQRDRLFIISYPSSFRSHEHIRKERYLQINSLRKNTESDKEWTYCEPESFKIRKILSTRQIDFIRSKYANEFALVSELRRVVDGVPERLDETARKIRIKQLGNSVIPQIFEAIGIAINDFDKEIINGFNR